MEVRHFSLPYTGLAWLYMEVRHQNILQQGGSESVKIRSSNVNIFCLEHFYTIRYNTFLHTFLCSTTYQKLVFYAGIPLTAVKLKKKELQKQPQRRFFKISVLFSGPGATFFTIFQDGLSICRINRHNFFQEGLSVR